MYRQYENPWSLQERLEAAERALSDAQAAGDDEERLIDLHREVEELRERVNFAWQDEYEE